MSKQFPPGPWRVTNNQGGWTCVSERNGCSSYQSIVDADGVVIALAVAHRDDFRSPEPERHSGLLAAAPQLLEALTRMCSVWETVCNSKGWEPDHMLQYVEAKEAIARATGDQQ